MIGNEKTIRVNMLPWCFLVPALSRDLSLAQSIDPLLDSPPFDLTVVNASFRKSLSNLKPALSAAKTGLSY